MPQILNPPRPFEQRDYPYFRRMWNKVVVALLAVSFVPLILLGGVMHYYGTAALKQRTLETLRLEVINHQKAIDRFLAERTRDLRLLADNLDLATLTQPGALKQVFQSLQEAMPCLVDLGIIDGQGRHLAYEGPYLLFSKNYKEAEWFKAVVEHGLYVSDMFLGFRKVPHFVIAIRKVTEQTVWILRATIDSAYFNEIVSEVIGERTGDAYLVNRDGIFQSTPRMAGRLSGQSEFKDLKPFAGVKLEERSKDVRAMVWLKNVPWLCVVKLDQDEIFKPLNRVRNVGIAVFVLGGILIVFTVLLTTNYLVSLLETKRRSIRSLDRQLHHTNRLSTSMQVSSGFVRDIKDALTNIDVAAQWIRDLIHGDISKEEKLKETEEILDQIKFEVARGVKFTDKLLRTTSGKPPLIREVGINEVLDDVVSFLDKEIQSLNITVKRDYQDHLPLIRSDPSQLHHVFQNLISNAMDAIRQDGEIALTTRLREEGVTVTVADTGPGISAENLEKIFEPLYSTKLGVAEPGLGLSTCAGILEKLGGRISVQSEPGKGACFIVELPLRVKSPGS